MAISTAVDASAVARVVGIKTEFKDLRNGGVLFLPQRIAVIGQGSTASTYSTDKIQLTTASSVGATFGYGSPLHLAALQLLPVNGDGVGTIPVTFYPLVDDGSAAPSIGDVTPSGAQTVAAAYRVSVNNILSAQFVISVGDAVATIVAAMVVAVNAVLEMPVVASDNTTDMVLTSKWEGVSANDIQIEILGSTTAGTTFALTQPVGGLVNPDIAAALAQIGDVWESMLLNCLNKSDEVALDLYQTEGEGRWGPLSHKPFIVFTGETTATANGAITIPETRKDDRVNAQLVAPGSKDLPLSVAARQLARIAPLANNNPPHDYGSQDATGLTPGTDAEQWLYPERDQAVKGGSSTIEVKDGVVNMSDTVTFYHPTGDPIPAYRFVVDIVKIQNIIFNLSLIFATKKWDGAPLIPDYQATVNPDAKKPKTAVADVCALIDSLGLNALISDPVFAKANTFAEIDAQNPKRLNVQTTMKLVGNTNIKSIDFDFGFFFGTPQVVA